VVAIFVQRVAICNVLPVVMVLVSVVCDILQSRGIIYSSVHRNSRMQKTEGIRLKDGRMLSQPLSTMSMTTNCRATF